VSKETFYGSWGSQGSCKLSKYEGLYLYKYNFKNRLKEHKESFEQEKIKEISNEVNRFLNEYKDERLFLMATDDIRTLKYIKDVIEFKIKGIEKDRKNIKNALALIENLKDKKYYNAIKCKATLPLSEWWLKIDMENPKFLNTKLTINDLEKLNWDDFLIHKGGKYIFIGNIVD